MPAHVTCDDRIHGLGDEAQLVAEAPGQPQQGTPGSSSGGQQNTDSSALDDGVGHVGERTSLHRILKFRE
ncbi:hypothetical protein ACFU6M_38610 [Streptomyces bottropensis]|uniref:hypothetical protein n=1 Tax=Streptomyces bottropensis TaxID=42235 RepID=UPI00368130F4